MTNPSTVNDSTTDGRSQTPPPLPSTKQPSSTPLKKKSPIQPLYSTLSHFHLRVIHALRTEMTDFFVGPMPVKEFLDKFLPRDKIASGSNCSIPSPFEPGCFSETFKAKSELDAYSPFVSKIVVWTTYTWLIFPRLRPAENWSPD
jgi:hypothetical protein